MEKFQQQLRAFLRGLTTAQVILLGGGIVLVALTVAGFTWLVDKADYKPLYTGLAAADAQKLTEELSAQNIEFRLSGDGSTVLVPSDQLDKARLDAASQGPLASGRMGFELFDKPNWSGSDFSEKVNYQRALEAELERTIQTMDGVEEVRVHLVLPHDSLFTDRERPAKAAVVLKMRGGRMSAGVADSIANLVSSAWDDLSPQNVSVITTDGQMPAQSHGELGSDPAGGSMDLEAAMAERVVDVLTPVVGAEHIKSSVTIEYDPTSAESTQDIYDPNASALLTSQVSQESSSDADPAGIPGTPSNAPNTPPQGKAATAANSSGESAEGMHSENKTFAVSHTTKHLTEPAGRFKRIAAAVLVDEISVAKPGGGFTRRQRSAAEMSQIGDLAKAALGFDASRGDQISVQQIAFQTPDSEPLSAPTAMEKVRTVSEHFTGLLQYALLIGLFLLVYALILNPVKKQVLAAFAAAAVPTALPAGQIAASGGALAAGNATTTAGSVAGNALSANGGSAAGAPAQLQQAMAMRQQVSTAVNQDAESAAQLVRGWLGEGGAS